jgi:hemoglobin-like flavoprotein
LLFALVAHRGNISAFSLNTYLFNDTHSLSSSWYSLCLLDRNQTADRYSAPSIEASIMSPEEITLVQTTWQKVAPIKETAAELFYGKLFQLDPSLRALFKGDMQEQGRKLMTMIGLAVTSLTRLEQLLPVVQDLGKRHASYGVTAAHYGTVATALIWTLEQGLGSDFSDDVKAAWVKTYTALANIMQEAAATIAA